MQQRYLGCAQFILNFLILFVLVNVGIGVWFSWHDRHAALPANVQHDAQVMNTDPQHFISPSLYDGETEAEVAQVTNDMLNWMKIGYPYAPWTGYGMPPFRSNTLNVDEVSPLLTRRHGVEDGLENVPPQRIRDLWILGGSTCFGLAVADKQTVAACLQRTLNTRLAAAHHELRVRVVNWGCVGYYSSQELALFLSLLKSQSRPWGVVFLDGDNDTLRLTVNPTDVPAYTDDIAAMVSQKQVVKNDMTQYTWIPMVRLGVTLHQALRGDTASTLGTVPLHPDRPAAIYRQNLDVLHAVCDHLRLPCTCFWQPVAYYHYDLAHTPAVPMWLYDRREAYAAACAKVHENPQGFVSLTDLAQQYGKPHVFIDFCHYTPLFTAYLAEHMADHLDLSQLQ